jgi:hypothetical protein
MLNEVGVGSKQIWELVSRTTPFESNKAQKARLEDARHHKDIDEFKEEPAEPEHFFTNQDNQTLYFMEQGKRDDLPPSVARRAQDNAHNLTYEVLHCRALAKDKTFALVYRYALAFRAECKKDCGAERRQWTEAPDTELWQRVREEAFEDSTARAMQALLLTKTGGGGGGGGDRNPGPPATFDSIPHAKGGGLRGGGGKGGGGDRNPVPTVTFDPSPHLIKRKEHDGRTDNQARLAKKRSTEGCFVCGKKGHLSYECKSGDGGDAVVAMPMSRRAKNAAAARAFLENNGGDDDT